MKWRCFIHHLIGGGSRIAALLIDSSWIIIGVELTTKKVYIETSSGVVKLAIIIILRTHSPEAELLKQPRKTQHCSIRRWNRTSMCKCLFLLYTLYQALYTYTCSNTTFRAMTYCRSREGIKGEKRKESKLSQCKLYGKRAYLVYWRRSKEVQRDLWKSFAASTRKNASER